MKTKLKKLDIVADMKIGEYTTKLKAELNRQLTLPAAETISFVFHAEFGFADGPAPLFIAGLNNDWRATIKSKWLKEAPKEILLGTCQRDGDTMNLVVKKGKLTQTRFRAAIKKNPALKKLTWNIIEAFDDNDNDLLAETPETDTDTDTDAPQIIPQSDKTPPNPNQDKTRAEALIAQLLPLVKQLSAADAKQKLKLIPNLQSLANQLYIIPKWKDYTPDKLEQVLAQIDDIAAAAELCAALAPLLDAFKKAQTPAEKQQIQTQLHSLSLTLFAIPNWRAYTPDNLEKVIGAFQPSPIDQQFIDKHNTAINEIATVQAYTDYAAQVAKQANTAATRAYAQNLQLAAAAMRDMETHLNDLLNQQEQLAQLINSNQLAPEQKAAAQELYQGLIQLTAQALN